MSKRKKFKTHCRSKSQPKAISRSYAIRNKTKTSNAKPKSKPPATRTKEGKVPQGRTLTTKDGYLDKKAKHPDKVRPLVVIEANANNDLAVVALSSRPGKDRTRLKSYEQGKSFFKHYVETTDNENKPIHINEKFKENHSNMDVSKEDVAKMRDKVFNHSSPAPENKKKMEKFNHKKNPRN